MTSNLENFTISGTPLSGDTTNTFYLLGTAAFAALPGAPTPDAIIPAGSVPFFAQSGDTVAFGGFDTWTFGAVPTDGTNSLNRGLPPSETAGNGANSPTNFAGATGSVTVPPPASVPLSAWPTLLLMLTLLLTVGIVWRTQSE